ncbi:nucleotidyl transferase AbiEii/AbiGii toxin family protein [Curtobacterium aetherium]|uniref:Nucleotidyl transferase AbiEii/AbiGii toxin family protein n=1 Tax=Curtobacterium aetherium TaxID=2841594 RepID=A0ACD1E2S3_9MICO|nr:nucleotidyl transferase AbiEii/AbiGii toxin family protein [Curtobacterium sp. L6-1]QWS33066.1 nucleotidyl transferase AbiEii/AbiGii toxin family protein [Curtobacterium sp. L6-1]
MTDATFTMDELGRLHALVDSLGETLDPSILIGGWATWLRLGGDSFFSRDIDLIVKSQSLRSTLRETLEDYSENPNLGGKKVRGTIDGIHIDAYIPYESELGGKLRLKVDVLANHVDPVPIKNWLLLNPEAHVISKMAALIDRPDSTKGSKDAREVMAMLFPAADSPFANLDSGYAIRILFDATAGSEADIPGHVAEIFELLPNIANVNRKQRKAIATLGKEWGNEAKDQLAARQRSANAPTFGSPPTRRKDVGQPGNGGKFSNRARPDSDATLL